MIKRYGASTYLWFNIEIFFSYSVIPFLKSLHLLMFKRRAFNNLYYENNLNCHGMMRMLWFPSEGAIMEVITMTLLFLNIQIFIEPKQRAHTVFYIY